MTAQLDAPVLDFGRLEEFAGKVSADQAAAYNAILVYLGDRLGLWRFLAELGSGTIDEVAGRSGIARRYVQEWLAAQAANGYVTYDATTETFTLSVEAAAVLAEEESPAALMAGFELIAAVWASVDKLAHAYTTGEGLAWLLCTCQRPPQADPRATAARRCLSASGPPARSGRLADQRRGATGVHADRPEGRRVRRIRHPAVRR